MKSGHTIQLLLSWMITWISAKFQALGMLLLCLLFLMFIDYITGMLASRKEGIDHPPYIVKSFFLENQGFFSVSSINISEEGAIGMDISLYLVRK